MEKLDGILKTELIAQSPPQKLDKKILYKYFFNGNKNGWPLHPPPLLHHPKKKQGKKKKEFWALTSAPTLM